jgi:type IV pilus assembly protein PilA
MIRNTRKGFTLIELLIVVVIIGILAAIAIPKFANTKEKAYIAAMKSDMKNLATAQEGYFADKQTYASLAEIGTGAGQLDWSPSKNNMTDVAVDGDAQGWSASIKDARVTGSIQTCSIYVGGANGTQGKAATNKAAGGATVEGTPACK